jgi:(2R)-ethylmalonyl-CoA mutase
VKHVPKWNPINVCSYHLQEAGATPVQELAYALATATAVLDAVRASGQVAAAEFSEVVGRISFFVNAGIRFVEECCKLRAFAGLWDDLARERYGVTDERLRRFRYGVQVNSLGLTESQPENNVPRIVLEMLAVVLSKNARARAVQLPAWNEALGLPRPWDQQWSLRIQQVMAFETDLLEYGDLLDGSPVVAAKVKELTDGARAEMKNVADLGGAVGAVESGYMKQQLVRSHAERLRAIEVGDLTIVGVNAFRESADSPLTKDAGGGILTVSADAEREAVEALRAHRSRRNPADAESALAALADAAKTDANLTPASIRCAHAGVTTGEWGGALRAVFGEYRPPTGIGITVRVSGDAAAVASLRARAKDTADALGGPIRVLVGKPGLDGHSNGAEQIAIKARDVGMEVVYEGIRLTPEQIVAGAVEEGVHLVGLSILSGSHLELIPAVVAGLTREGLTGVPVVVGGIIPETDARLLREQGVARVYTPRDTDLNRIMADMIDEVRKANGLPAFGP